MNVSSWTNHLNKEQQEAVLHNHGPLLILAAAGSGKTTVLINRAGRLIQEGIVGPEQLLVLTFTNKAARELKDRVMQKLGKLGKKIWAGTFHSFGYQFLRQHAKLAGLRENFSLMDATDATYLIRELLKDFKHPGKEGFDIDKIQFCLSSLREKKNFSFTVDEAYAEATHWLLPRFLKKCTQLNVVDFDSLILKPFEVLEQHPGLAEQIGLQYQQIMVDEFQDTNEMQMKLILKLAHHHKNLCVVGDDDQAIYGWRGAEVKNILNFPSFFSGCRVIKLEWNYRSNPEILNLANAIIHKNEQRHSKTLKTLKQKNEALLPDFFEFENEVQEADGVVAEIEKLKDLGIPLDEIAILFRTNQQGAFLEAELRKHRIAYLLRGGTQFFERKECKDLLAFLKLISKPSEISLRRILNVPPRGVGDKAFQKLDDYCLSNQKTFLEAFFEIERVGLDSKTMQNIQTLRQQLQTLKQSLQSAREIRAELFLEFLKSIGYQAYLSTTTKDPLTAYKRAQWVDIFCSVLDGFLNREGRSFEQISAFIENIELREILENEKESKDKVQLLTLHASKGLEFKVVFLVGLEEDILPHKTLGSDVSEERRLFYVGVTRAKEKLVLTRAKERQKQGRSRPSVISRFMLEVPKDLYKNHGLGRPVDPSVRKQMLADLFKKIDSLSS